MELRLAAWSVLPAAVAAGLLLALGWLPWRKPEATRRARALGAVAFAVGYALGHLQGDFDLPLPPREATHRFLYLALGAGLVGLVEACACGGHALRLAVRAGTAVAVPWWFLSTFVARWEAGFAALTVAGLAAGILVLWSGLDALAQRRPGLTWPLALWGVASAGSVALLQSGNATYALFAASLAGVLGAAGVVALWHPAVEFSGGAAAVASVVLACLWMGGAYLSELPVPSAVLLGLAPLAAWVGELRTVRARGPVLGAAVALGAALVPAGVALGLAIANAPEPYDPYDY